MHKNHLLALGLATATVIGSPLAAKAVSFLDLTGVTPGSGGSFTGILGGTTVNGSLSGPANFLITGVNNATFDGTTIDNTSPQYGSTNIYKPSQAFGDRVGYNMFNVSGSTATLTLNFSSAVKNPVFHVANLDSMIYDFSGNAGIGLILLRGNGGGGDGLTVDNVGKIIGDADPNTLGAVSPFAPIPTSGGRSAYGSVQLQGSFTSLNIGLRANPTALSGDGGTFTVSVPWETDALSVGITTALFGFGLFCKHKFGQTSLKDKD